MVPEYPPRHSGPAPESDAAKWDALTAWFASAVLPPRPYRLNRAVMVEDPVTSHAWLRERIADGCRGQVRLAVLARLRLLRERFGG